MLYSQFGVISGRISAWRVAISNHAVAVPVHGEMQAKAVGCDDAWMAEDGYVTEGASNNAHIIKDGRIITRHLGNEIPPLPGQPSRPMQNRRRCK
jgi:D-alanine transaminase